MTQQTDDFELIASTHEETSSGTAESLQGELSAARRRISELESLTQHSAEASHVQRVEDLQTQLYSQQDSVGESRLKLEGALQDSQRELSETKQSLEQAIATIAKLTASESLRMCKCNSPLIGGPGGSPFQLTSIAEGPARRVERITCWSQPSGKDEIRAIEVEFEDGHTALAGRRVADATVQESFSFMEDELLLQCTSISDAKDTRLAGFSFVTSLGRAFHAGPGTVTSGHAVTWLQDCPALLLGISGSGGAAIDRLAFIIQVCGRP